MLDEIEEETLETTKDEERAIFKGMLWNVKSGFFKDFEPDLPCSLFTASQVPLDPFRTRLWDIPPGGCPVPPNVGVTIKRKRKSATSTITLLSSNATNKAKRSSARVSNSAHPIANEHLNVSGRKRKSNGAAVFESEPANREAEEFGGATAGGLRFVLVIV